MAKEKLYKLEEVAVMLGVSKKTLRVWDNEGKLKAMRTAGGHRVYRETDIELYVQESEGTDFLKKEITEHFSRGTDAEQEVTRLNAIINRMETEKNGIVKEILQVQTSYHSMFQLLNICRQQMLPMELAKEIDRTLRDAKDYL